MSRFLSFALLLFARLISVNSVDIRSFRAASALNVTDHRAAPPLAVIEEPAPSIIVSQSERHWWGFPNYLSDLDSGLRTWTAFARTHGHKGRTCTPETSRQRCGDPYVCRADICAECQMSRDCGEKFLCQAFPSLPGSSKDVIGVAKNLCIPRDLYVQWTHYEGIATVLIIITAMFSAAAGMGGGGVYVPLLLLLLGLSSKEAVPLSQAMIVGGAIINIVMFCGDRHPKFPSKPKIDYNVIMMLNPGMAAGVMIGVTLNVMSPQWLIVVVLIFTLVLALEKSYHKGVQGWQKESKLLAEQAAKGEGGAPAKIEIKLADFPTALVLAKDNVKQLSLIIGCWLTFLVVNLFKAQACSPMYWAQFCAMIIVCGLFTQAGAKTILENQNESKVSQEGELQWNSKSLWLYPLLSTVAGFLGGFLGIGGGIIMGPVLLELGMAPEASQATTAMFVLLSSSLATLQFVIMGKTMPAYALWFTTWVVGATFVGQTGIDYILKKYQRASIIVLSVAVIIAGSLVMMTAIGVNDVVVDMNRGADMGFAPHQLCTGR